ARCPGSTPSSTGPGASSCRRPTSRPWACATGCGWRRSPRTCRSGPTTSTRESHEHDQRRTDRIPRARGAPPVLRGVDLHRTFGSGAGEVHALAGVGLAVPAGQLTVVRGPSGSGKTTLLNLLGGLDRPTGGRVLLDDDRVLSELPEKDVLAVRRERIGYVFQSFGLVPVLSAAENVEVPLRLRRVPVA